MSGYKRSYTIQEDNKILTYIVSTGSFYHLKGVLFWKQLEDSQAFHGTRTWMSLKNRFIKSILPSIHNDLYTLSDSDKKKIVDGYFNRPIVEECEIKESGSSNPQLDDTVGTPDSDDVIVINS
ncbi:uncharacterized protein LOC130447240 [Diorhabda sublineata]|uniref:uncharacterized protein LOC130447240 n=1 Tax=Diorhabda sublineata TaxID=1163346 RepID=UPI0024E0B200|nr:uncharacterized protein LOC130447240 [Diorhabda sublineata]